jgi:predicted transcriptional regulator
VTGKIELTTDAEILSKLEGDVLRFLFQNRELAFSTRELVERLDISESRTRTALKKLLDKHLIERAPVNRTFYYHIREIERPKRKRPGILRRVINWFKRHL